MVENTSTTFRTQYWPAKEINRKAIIYAKLALIYRSFQISFLGKRSLTLLFIQSRETGMLGMLEDSLFISKIPSRHSLSDEIIFIRNGSACKNSIKKGFHNSFILFEI